MTEHNCPICKGKVSEEAERHVMSELAKIALDPKHLVTIYKGDKK